MSMETANLDARALPSPKTAADQQRRHAWEAEGIAEADAQIDADLFVDADEIKAWINSIGTDQELSLLPTRHR